MLWFRVVPTWPSAPAARLPSPAHGLLHRAWACCYRPLAVFFRDVMHLWSVVSHRMDLPHPDLLEPEARTDNPQMPRVRHRASSSCNPMYNYIAVHARRSSVQTSTALAHRACAMRLVWAVIALVRWRRGLQEDRAQVHPLHLGNSRLCHDVTLTATPATEEYAIEVNDVSMIFNMASEQLNNLKEYFIKLVKARAVLQGVPRPQAH